MQHLCNDTAINVAGLLKVQTGQVREFELALDRFPLDDGLFAVDVAGELRLTRLRDGIMARVTTAGAVDLECARCLRAYQQPFDIAFSEEYRQTVDVYTGAGVEAEVATDEDTARIDDNHLLDIGEVLRQEILVALPMRPDCGERCPGPDLAAIRWSGDDEAPVDGRLAALARLLEERDGE